MAKQRKVWMVSSRPSLKPSVPDSVRAELETKAADLIENVLKPKHLRPAPAKADFNYLSGIGVKWYRNYFYFVSTYACPGPNAVSPSFEEKFARMEYLGDGKFDISFMRYTGEWVGMYEGLTMDESLKNIQDDPWFVP